MNKQHLNSAIAQTILAALPENIRKAYLDHAAEIEYPVEAVLEMEIASFLDTEALGFIDCKPERAQSLEVRSTGQLS